MAVVSEKRNIYYEPAAFGLEIVAEHDFSDWSYQFDTRVVWRDREGRLYTARDSGCSCPSPFEDYEGVESLERLTTPDPLRTEYREELKNHESYPEGTNIEGWGSFIEKVEAALLALRNV